MAEFGVFIFDGNTWIRPKSKAQLRRIEKPLERICLEGISPYVDTIQDGTTKKLSQLPDGRYYIVGPDPYNSRKFYGSIILAENGQVYIK